MNSNSKKQFIQGGLIGTVNLNGYFRSAHVTFKKSYKAGTKPIISGTIRNYGNTDTDSRLTVLFKNESASGVDLFVADPEGKIEGMGYEVCWIAVGEID